MSRRGEPGAGQDAKLRVAPVLVVVTVFVIGLAGAGVSRAGFAWVQPESFLAEEIAKDPTLTHRGSA